MSPQARFAWDALEFRTPVMLRIVGSLSGEAFGWWPPNKSNSVAWLLWHIAEVEDNWVRDKVYGLPKRYPFGASVRSTPPEAFPDKAALVAYFHEVRTLSRERLDETSDADFDRVVQDEHFGPITVRQVWAGVATSCAWHSGQIALTARLAPRPPARQPETTFIPRARQLSASAGVTSSKGGGRSGCACNAANERHALRGLVMKSMLALLGMLAVGVGIDMGTGRADAPKQAEDPLPAGATLRLGTTRFRHGIPVSMMAVSEKGRIAVAVNGNHMLGATRGFDLDSGRVLYTLGGSEGLDIEAAAISADGRTLVTKQDFSLRVRDAATGKETRKIDLPRASASYSRNEWLAFTPDGNAIAVTSQGKVIHLIDFASGKTIREFSNDNPESGVTTDFSEVLGIAFSPDGKRMASGGFANDKNNYFARLWDVESGKELRRFMHGRSYGIEALAFSPDGKTLATGAHDARLRLFDVDSGKELRKFPANGKSRMHGGCVAFAPDGKTVAAAGEALRLYDVTSGEERWHIDRRALGLVFTDGGKTLTGAVSGAICRWDAATGKLLTPEGGDSPVEQIIVSADGSRVVTRGTDGDAHIWDATSGEHLRYLRATWQHGVAMTPDGRFVAWPVEDESVKFPDPASPRLIYSGSRIPLYDVVGDKIVDRFPVFKGDANELTFINGGKQLVIVDHRDGDVRIWNVEAGKEERSFQALREDEKKLPNPVWRTDLSPDGKTLAVAYVLRRPGRGTFPDETYPIRAWDVATGKELHELASSGARYVRNMAFSPDGRWLVSSGSEFDEISAKGQLAVWDISTGKSAATLPTGACTVAFSADGRYLATATPDGTIRVWETATWTMRNEYTGGHRDRPTALAFAPNRPLLFSGSLDTSVLAWDLSRPTHADPAR